MYFTNSFCKTQRYNRGTVRHSRGKPCNISLYLNKKSGLIESSGYLLQPDLQNYS